MRTKTKALVTALCAVLLVVASVLGTMAYLTSQDTVKNTFTVGNVKITLDEKDVDKDQNTADNVTLPTGEVRDKANKYHLIPGNTYVKDPTVHVDANSESCWLFVKLQTIPIFTKVKFADHMSNMYQNSKAEIKIDAKAVQSANNGDSAIDAAGWPETN